MDYLGTFLLASPLILVALIIIRWLHQDYTKQDRERREQRWRMEEQQAQISRRLAEQDELERQFQLPEYEGEDR